MRIQGFTRNSRTADFGPLQRAAYPAKGTGVSEGASQGIQEPVTGMIAAQESKPESYPIDDVDNVSCGTD